MRAPIWALAIFVCAGSSAQTIGLDSWTHSTADLSRTVQFYFQAFGLDSPDPPQPPNPSVPALINVPGATRQGAMLRFPGAPFGFELTRFQPANFGNETESRRAQANPWDPGAARLIIQATNIDPIFLALKKAGAAVVTHSGAPVRMRDTREALLRDPDGYLIDLVEGDALTVSMGLTVNSLQETAKFYHDMFGFQMHGLTEFASDLAVADALGLPMPAAYRTMTAIIPGTSALIQFAEFSKRLDRTPFRHPVSDPGTPAISLRVAGLDRLLDRLKSAGATVVSQGGVPVQFSPTIRDVFVEDPNGFKIELYEQR